MFRKMRRINQQLSDAEVEAILQRGNTAILGVLGDDGYPYTIPLNYVYMNGRIYMHCAKSGHKYDAICNCDKVSLCIIDKEEVVPETLSTNYGSVIAFGRAKIMDDTEEMIKAVTALSLKYGATKENVEKEIPMELKALACIEISIEYITGKRSKKGYN